MNPMPDSLEPGHHLGEILRWRAAHRPAKSAFIFLADGEGDARPLSYAELDARARALAATLQARGLVKERILMLYPTGLEFLAAMMGCVYANAVAIPVPAHLKDPERLHRTLPRLRAIAADAGAKAVLTCSELETELIFAAAPELSRLDWILSDVIPAESASNWRAGPIDPQSDVMFLQYSSGSTGQPKGVMVSHANLLHNSAAIQQAFGNTEQTVAVSWLPAYHDMGLVADMLQPIYAGYTQVFMSPFDFIARPLRWLEAISRYQASLSGAPNFAYALCAEKAARLDSAARASLDLSSWQIAYNCAEPVNADVIEAFATRFAPCGFRAEAFFPYLGMAEATLMVTAGDKAAAPPILRLERRGLKQGRVSLAEDELAPEAVQRLVGCGRSLPDQLIRIVDPDSLRLCPPNQIGEIWVQGPSVAQGYWQQPEQTHEAFQAEMLRPAFASPDQQPVVASPAAGQNWLRTGDLGFVYAQELYLTGRLKDLIILQGQNHWPQDIEKSVESSHIAIRKGCSAAFAISDAQGENLAVIAEVDAVDGLDFQQLVTAIQAEVLAEHQVLPARVALIRARGMLKTSSGKVQRKACRTALETGNLPLLYDTANPAPAEVAPAANLPETRILTALFCELLGLSEIDQQQHFFALGGHSLLATRLGVRLREQLGLEVPLRMLFEHPTIAQLAPMLANLRRQKRIEPALPPIKALRRDLPARLSYAQERMWFLDQLQAGSGVYNVPLLFALSGDLHIEALEQAWGDLIRRHSGLRSRFVTGSEASGAPLQVIDPADELRLVVEDLSRSDAPEIAADALIGPAIAQAFVLSQGPLLRVKLIKLAQDRHLLLIVVHHIVFDGWSASLLLQELAQAYAARCQSQAPGFGALAAEYPDYAAWQRGWLGGAELQRQLAYWTQRLADAPALLQLPADRPRPASESHAGASLDFLIDAQLTRQLAKLATARDVTLFMLLLAAFEVLLSRYSQQTDICVGIPIANRRTQELEPLIGFFVNTLVIRGELGDNPAFDVFLARIREACLEAYAHQDLPFEKLVEELNPERSLSHHPLFQVMFVLQEAGYGQLALKGLKATPRSWPGLVSKFDLSLELIPAGETLRGRFEYNRELFAASTIARLSAHFLTLLAGLPAHLATGVGQLPLLSQAERHKLLVEWNATARAFDLDQTAHALFSRQARQTPAALALIAPDARLSYRELDEASNRLAHLLHARGIGAGMRVGISLPRDSRLIIGILGILKAGASYVPLDPAYPPERVAYLRADARLDLLLDESFLLSEAAGLAAASTAPTGYLAGPLSHIIYTSGSTGQPKGVTIRHRGTSALIHWAQTVYSAQELRGVLAGTSVCFDLSVFEIFVPLSRGGTVILVEDVLSLAANGFDAEVSLINTVPSAIEQLLRLNAIPASVETLNLAGEPLKQSLVAELYAGSSAQKIYDLYGPSEDTTYTTWALRRPDQPATIGRPIANTQIYLLDAHGAPVPLGVAGELHIGGEGLAEGYLHRPELTAEKFIANPFGPGRLYKTGDLARYAPDGKLSFLGRADHQVKLRGFRIEPGEIEKQLRDAGGVQDALVLCRLEPEHRDLVAYVVPAAVPASAERAQIDQWQAIYQQTYQARQQPEQTANIEPGSDFSGWNSSYTGEPIPTAEMQAWRQSTVARILALKPQKLYEIGCGTGLLLAKIAPEIASYTASDFSPAVIASVNQLLPSLGASRVEALIRSAEDFSGLPQDFDTIVLNSVIQYFPSAAYLKQVLTGALARLAPGGKIFIGDVRHLGLLEAFRTTVTLLRAEAGVTAAALAERIGSQIRHEEELCLAPAFFLQLRQDFPSIGAVEILLKQDQPLNELSSFRYDVILSLKPAGPSLPVLWQAAAAGVFQLDELIATFKRHAGRQAVGLRGIPDRRVLGALEAGRQLTEALATEPDLPWHPADRLRGQSLQAFAGFTDKSIDPDELLDRLRRELGAEALIRLCPAAEPGCFDLVLAPAGVQPEMFAGHAWRVKPGQADKLANQPARAKARAGLIPALKAHLGAVLPEYMVPAHFVLLDAMPLTPNGKIDRKALPAPEALHQYASSTSYRAPTTVPEEILCEIFAEVLGLSRVGIHDHFFDLGGHSLLATQLAARIRERFAGELPLRRIFEAPTVAELAAQLSETGSPALAQTPELPAIARSGDLPLSFAQERLWFMEQWQPGSALYHVPNLFRLEGELNHTALRQSLQALLERHESLRSHFGRRGEQVYQVIEPSWNLELVQRDCANPDSARERVQQDIQLPFELLSGPLFRVALYRLGARQHWLLLNLHHAITDGWSIGLLLQELGALYAGFCRQRPAELPGLERQYADYAGWQRDWLQGANEQRLLDYWRQRLAGAPTLIQLPTDRPRPAIESYAGGKFDFSLPAELAARLETLARAHDATLFMLLLAAFEVLLARFSGQSDLCVGIPIANRRLKETEPMLGLFVNTLVIRGDLGGDPPFASFLARVRETCLEAYAHQELPFEKLVEALRPERSLSHHPLFQVMFVYQDAALAALNLQGLSVSPLAPGGALSKFDLSLELRPQALDSAQHAQSQGFSGRFEYNRDLFDATTIARWAGHLLTLLEAIASQPQTPIQRLNLLSPAQRRQLLVDWNQTAIAYPRDQCVHQLIESQIERSPDKTAIVFAGESMSYDALNRAANRLAHHLRDLGVGPEVLVGLSVERSLELMIGVLAILKAGGAYVPLDPGYPPERVLYMLRDTQAPLVLTQTAHAPLFAAQPVKVLCLDVDSAAWANQPDTNPDSKVQLDNLISIIYTSGSTGRPKGVMNTQLGAYNHLMYRRTSLLGVAADDRIMQKTSINFDGSVWELFLPLIAGATIYFAAPAAHKDPGYLCRFIQTHGIHLIDFVPSMLQEALNDPEMRKCTSLRRFLIGGEGLSYPLQQSVFAKMPGIKITHGYGPTESTISVIYWECVPEGPLRTVPVGRPIANTRLYILDQQLEPVPIGVAGEMFIGGDGLARGYWQRPELTAEKFIPNPFGPGKLYRSGDLMRYLPDGNVEFVGRADQQIKLRGFRIELGEIECVLREHAAIRDAAVLLREDRPGDKRLVAYLVQGAQERPTISALREHLKQRLPDYMLPAAYIWLPALPLTANDKLDRRALPAPSGREAADAAHVPPTTAHEKRLCAIFADLLQREQVGIHDSFFDLGGHSLLATRLVSRLREQLQLELPLRRIFETPSVAELARGIEALQAETLPEITPVDRSQPLRLSYAQERLWFMDQLAPNQALYNIPIALRLQGELNVPALEKSLQLLILRHESLRTRFARSGPQAEPIQIVDAASSWRLERQDLRADGQDVAAAESRALQIARADAYAPFDLATGPLLRVKLLKWAEQDHLLVLNLHHIISDGWSWRVMLQELDQAYAAFASGQSPALPALPVQYADYAAWQRAWLTGEQLTRQLEYWKARLAQAPELLQLPTDRPRPAIDSYRGARSEFSLSAELVADLHALARAQGVTPFMLLLAAFEVLLARYSRQQDICVGIPIANRRLHQVEPLIGFFVNTLVIRGDLSAAPAFSDFLAQIRTRCLEAYAHQDLPFEKLVEELNPRRSLSHHPLFQVLFVLQDAGGAGFAPEGLSVSAADLGSRLSRFDLALELIPDGPDEQGLKARIEYSRDLFDPSSVARLIGHYAELLTAIVADPDQSIDRLNLLPAAEQELLASWNQTQAPYRREIAVHRLFEEFAASQPEALAVLWRDRRLSYAELNAEANRFARALQQRGVRRGQLVGLSVEKSTGMLMALLGILKAGAAYVPLDPGYPRERLAYMLDDAAVALLVSEAHLLAALPPSGCEVLVLDDKPWAQQSGENLPRLTDEAQDLAYVIYTSGSSGRPKGVSIAHQGLCNLVVAQQLAYGVRPDDRVLQHASLSFDASIFEILLALGAGAALCLGSKQELLPGPALHRFLREHAVSILNLPPSVLALLPPFAPGSQSSDKRGGKGSTSLRALIVAGEACPPALARTWAGICRFYNAYGPTEATVWSSVAEIQPGQSLTNVPIGKPVANTQLYIVDAQLAPVPIGVAGELLIGGAGLARGYLHQPELTAAKFIANPFGAGKLYRTGDLARWTAEGQIEFLGRLDAQVKLRGFRIEPGEIEQTLLRHAAVQEALVVCRDNAGQASLVAYLVPGRGEVTATQEAEHIGQWQSLYQDTYSTVPAAAAPAGSDFSGWNSSYTGEPIPLAQMQAWRQATVARILGLSPRRVYEIGCGTGLLLAKIAPEVESYIASDFSAAVVANVETLKQRAGLTQLRVMQRVADDFSGIQAGEFETLILNSVIQYFPTTGYLRQVLEQALTRIAPGGRIFLGDVRHLAQLEAFHAAIAIARAEAGASREQIRQRMRKQLEREEELCLDPAFFLALASELPGIGAIELLLKQGQAHNELNGFRYDVVLHAAPSPASVPVSWSEWQAQQNLADQLDDLLARARQAKTKLDASALGLGQIPNARVTAAFTALAGLTGSQAESPVPIEPQAIWAWAARQELEGLSLRVVPDARPACFAVVLTNSASLPDLHRLKVAGRQLANRPLKAKAPSGLIPALRAHVSATLPDYMIPAHFVLLEALPLTPNGKIDRKALPAPEKSRAQTGKAYLAPTTPQEALICEIFAEVLGLDQVGIGDNFFDLGGHSLLATQLAARIREQLLVELPLRRLFEAPTPAGLAAGIQGLKAQGLPQIQPAPRGIAQKLGYSQELWWFLFPRRADLEHGVQNSYAGLRLEGALNAEALARSLQTIVDRHEALRTHFTGIETKPLRVIQPQLTLRLEIADIAGHDEARAVKQLQDDAEKPFDLATGPLIRARLYRQGPRRHLLMISISHLVFDGWSLKILLRELDLLYAAYAAGQTPGLAPLPVQYSDYVHWHRRWIKGSVLRQQMLYWLMKGRNMPVVLDLPTDKPRPELLTMNGASVSFTLDQAVSDAIQAFCQRHDITAYMFLLGAFQVLLHRFSGQTDIFVGTPVANRRAQQSEQLIGLFLNFIVLRGDLAGRPQFSDYLRQVRDTCLEAYAHQDLPFQMLLKSFKAFKTLTTFRSFQTEKSLRSNVMFNLLDDLGGELSIGGLQARFLALETRYCSQTLHLILSRSSQGLGGQLIYSTDLFEAATVRRLTMDYQALIQELLADPDTCVSLDSVRTGSGPRA